MLLRIMDACSISSYSLAATRLRFTIVSSGHRTPASSARSAAQAARSAAALDAPVDRAQKMSTNASNTRRLISSGNN